jgi:hypothetical protein
MLMLPLAVKESTSPSPKGIKDLNDQSMTIDQITKVVDINSNKKYGSRQK